MILNAIIFAVIMVLCIVYNPVVVIFCLLVGAPFWLLLYFVLCIVWYTITGKR